MGDLNPHTSVITLCEQIKSCLRQFQTALTKQLLAINKQSTCNTDRMGVTVCYVDTYLRVNTFYGTDSEKTGVATLASTPEKGDLTGIKKDTAKQEKIQSTRRYNSKLVCAQ